MEFNRSQYEKLTVDELIKIIENAFNALKLSNQNRESDYNTIVKLKDEVLLLKNQSNIDQSQTILNLEDKISEYREQEENCRILLSQLNYKYSENLSLDINLKNFLSTINLYIEDTNNE